MSGSSRWIAGGVAGLLAAGLLAAVSPSGASGAVAQHEPCPLQGLTAVSADAPDDVWITGTCNGFVGTDAVVEHWNGTSWHRQIVDGAEGGDFNYLSSISAVSSKDVWVAGNYVDDEEDPGQYIDHWNGSTWVLTRGDGQADWAGISAVSATQAYVLGTLGRVRSVILSIQPHRRKIESAPLKGISMASATDGWAVGRRVSRHWDGTRWSPVPVPADPGSTISLTSVSATSMDAWAVGSVSAGGSVDQLAEHYIDGVWTAVALPAVTGTSGLTAVSAQSPTDVWAVGNTTSGRMYSLHWDGSSWTVAYLDSDGFNQPHVDGVTSVPGGVWAVGGQVREFWDGTSWSVR